MKASKVKELIKQSLLELEAEKKNTSNSGPMTPEEEEMIKRYEEEEANKYALEKEEPLEEGDVMKKAREIVAKHKEMTESEEGPEDISDYDRGKIETGKANTLARSINAAIVEVDPELHVETFAKSVAQVLKREYGTHLSAEFIAALRDNLRGFEDVISEADRIVETWKRKNLLKESEKPVSDYSKRREREKDYTPAKSDKPKKAHTSDSHEESDYIKRRKKEMYEVNEGMGDEKWASDGGYYTKPDTSITVSKETADLINQTIEEFKRDIQDESESVMVDKTEKGQINLKIIRDLQKNWNISFEHDTEDGRQSFYWLSPNQSMEDLNDGLENAWQLFYDRVQKKLNESNGDFLESAAMEFPELVEKYGLETVKTTLDAIYENAWYNAHDLRMSDEEANEYALDQFDMKLDDFKADPDELEDLILSA